MQLPSANLLKTACVALALTLAWPALAESQKSPPPVGATREQVVERLGEPKSQLKAGSREILFFSHWKVTLRYDVVVETEEVTDDSSPSTARPAEVPAAAKSGDAAAPSAAKPSNAASTSETSASATVVESATAAASASKSAPEGDSGLEIRIIRRPPAGTKSAPTPTQPAQSVRTMEAPPSGNATAAKQPAPVAVSPAKPVATETVAPPASAPPPASTSAPPPPSTSATPSVAETPAPAQRTEQLTPPTATADSQAKPEPPTAIAATDATPPSDTPAASADETTVAPPPPSQTTASKLLFRRRRIDFTEPALKLVSAQTYVLAVVVVGCVALLFWRRSQRQAELSATTVSNTPLAAPVAETGATFTADMLGKLDEGRFERLVAAYYTKTGVVAEPASASLGAAIHIKIFWKGEPKPFAGVQCHAHPPSLIPVKPLQELFTALSAAEIRRGYVVTTGKFNVEARDFAEEKHFTLLSGDLFLEKLNALPPSARAELLSETAAEPSLPADRATT